ncbi:MAG: SH3 domain-containing protein [Candidatus Peribacteraceae bacterium]|nr:SH3 domain-containing protein [Candidatus Peribacteraceae bacterium]
MSSSYSYPRTATVRRRHSARSANGSSVVAFLLVACFGILFAGCGSPPPEEGTADEFAFTEQDVARFRELVMEGGSGSSIQPHLVSDEGSDTNLSSLPVLDLSNIDTYRAIRGGASDGGDIYRVTNEFVNIRSSASVTSSLVDRLKRGDRMELLAFPNAAWAKILLPNGSEGFVSSRYIAKATSGEELSAEKEKFAGQYFVNFGFLNVRSQPDADSEKLGELPSQAIVKPLSMDDVWARITFEGKEGYVAVQYLKSFTPNFLVQQRTYTLPVLHYNMERENIEDVLVQHIAKLKESGVRILTFADFSDILLKQQERDVRVDPNSIILCISGVDADSIKSVSDILHASNTDATFFLQTNLLGIDGISEKMILTLLANGNDIQSALHTGDDLRSLTNSQGELELKQSRQLLEEATSRPVNAVLYPLGGVNDRVQTLASDAGYLFGIGAENERIFKRDYLLQMPSFSILPTMTAEDVITIALGAEDLEE